MDALFQQVRAVALPLAVLVAFVALMWVVVLPWVTRMAVIIN